MKEYKSIVLGKSIGIFSKVWPIPIQFLYCMGHTNTNSNFVLAILVLQYLYCNTSRYANACMLGDYFFNNFYTFYVLLMIYLFQ